ncbi:MAG: TolC family protein [Planctomycetota bacterium]|jgi:outer membrane protein TolC
MAQHKMMGTLLLAISLLFSGCSAEQNDFDVTRYNLETDVSSTRASGSVVSEWKLPELNESSGLPDFLAYAALNNPGLQAAFDRWKAQLERVPQVKALPDPRFNYTYFIQEVETRVGPQRQGYGISQMFPWFGKLDLRSDIAMQAANAARQRYEAIKLKLFFEVKDAYYEYYYLGKSVAITEENVNLIKHLESVARSRYKAAAGSHPDVIRAQVEAGKLEDHLRTLLDLRGPVVARLNATLNRPVEASISWPRDVVLEEVKVRDEKLLAALVATNPELKALDFKITQSKSGIKLAKKDYYPDFSLGMSYIETDDSAVGSPSDNGKDPVIAMISINLPFWRGKYDAGVREALARHRAARRDKKEMENSLSSQLKMVVYRFRDAERKIDLYRDTLVPKARESLKVTESGFRAGTGSFTDLIDAERILLEFSLAYERALANHGQELAKLEMLVGQEIPREGNQNNESNVIDNKTGDSKMEIAK